jgi:hypothetical protein
MLHSARLTTTALLSLFGAAAIAACSGQIGTPLDVGGLGSGAGTGSGATGTGGLGLGTNGSSGTGGDGFEQCQAIENAATKIPVSMFIQIDKSGSMGENNKWGNAKNAFTKFVNDPKAQDGLNVALRFWPDAGCDNATCSTAKCAQPQVPLGPLSDPNQVQQLVSLFNSKSPAGLTPMSAALAGATQWAVSQQTMAEKKEKVVVILMTDGEPTACDTNIAHIAKFASDAYAQKEILTFAVGFVGSKQSDMDAIANAGHTGKGFYIGNGNAEADLLAALKKIQDSVVSCAYAMPESPDPNQSIDPKLVNINYQPGDGSKSVSFSQVANESACGSDTASWYYDDPDHPAAILLCPKTCDLVQTDQNAKIKVVLGCATKAK